VLKGVDVSAFTQWEGACGPPDFCNSDSVVFPSTSDAAITEDYFVSIDYKAATGQVNDNNFSFLCIDFFFCID